MSEIPDKTLQTDGMTVRLAVGIMQAALDCIVVIDHESHIMEWNESAAEVFGYSRAEALGNLMPDLIVPPDLRAAHHAGLNTYLSTGNGPILNKRIEVTAMKKSGEIFPVELAVVPIDEEPPRFAAYLRDITGRKEAEASLIEAEARQRIFLRDILLSVTEGRLRLCQNLDDLPIRLPAIGQPVPLSAPTLRVLRQQINQAIQTAELNKERGGDFLIAASEAAMNAIVHAGGGTATVGASKDTGRVQIWVEDTGTGIEMSHLPRATLDRGYTTAGTLGHGFKLTLTTADTVWLLTGPTGTTVVVEQNRDTPLPPWIEKVQKIVPPPLP